MAIRPSVVGGVPDVDAEVETLSGMVAAAWQREERAFAMQVTVPVNTRAEVSVPKVGQGAVAVCEGEEPVWEEGVYRPGVAGIDTGEENGDAITVQVLPGRLRLL